LISTCCILVPVDFLISAFALHISSLLLFTCRTCGIQSVCSYVLLPAPCHWFIQTGYLFEGEYSVPSCMKMKFFSYCAHSFSSIYMDELYTMHQALLFIWQQPQVCCFVFRLSKCLAESSRTYAELSSHSGDSVTAVSSPEGKEIIFSCWKPGHIGLQGMRLIMLLLKELLYSEIQHQTEL
jgi:hypothetical protein